VKAALTKIKMEKHKQRSARTFFFLQAKKTKAIHEEPTGVLEDATVRFPTVKRWCRCFKQAAFRLTTNPGRGDL
jgi:hypothetical protein